MAGGVPQGRQPLGERAVFALRKPISLHGYNDPRTHRVAMYKCALPLLRLTPASGFVFAPHLPLPRTDGFRRNPKVRPPDRVRLRVWCFVATLNRCGSRDRFQHAVTLRGRSPLALPPDICSPVMLC